jgi:hypothetical protein
MAVDLSSGKVGVVVLVVQMPWDGQGSGALFQQMVGGIWDEWRRLWKSLETALTVEN